MSFNTGGLYDFGRHREDERGWSLTPPDRYNSPIEMYMWGAGFEPKLNVKTSRQYLEEYPAETSSMRKAKEYWLNFQESNNNREEHEKLRKEASQEAEIIRKDVWQWHIVVLSEDTLSGAYHLSAWDPLFENEYPLQKKFYLKDPHVNQANINIFSELNIPENFINFSDYVKLEPKDADTSLRFIKKFPEVSVGIKEAKKYWSQNLSPEKALSIKNTYPKEVEKFRELLWKSHLMEEGLRKRDEFVCQEWRKEAESKDRKVRWVGTAVCLAFISAGFFLSVRHPPILRFVSQQFCSAVLFGIDLQDYFR